MATPLTRRPDSDGDSPSDGVLVLLVLVGLATLRRATR
jgi:MYXO-CTERM domain-containing protein